MLNYFRPETVNRGFGNKLMLVKIPHGGYLEEILKFVC